MKRPGAGDRDKRAVFRLRNDTSQGDDGLVSGYTEVGRRWALLEPLGTLLVNSGIQTDNKITHRLTFKRLRVALDNRHEVIIGSRLFRVSRVGDVNEAGIDSVLDLEDITGNPASTESMPEKDYYDE